MFISMRIFIKATNRSLIEIWPSAGALRRRIRKSCSALGIKVNELGLRRIGISHGKGICCSAPRALFGFRLGFNEFIKWI